MPFEIGILDSEERARQKQLSRDADSSRMSSGIVSREDLSRENGFFSSLPILTFRIVAIGSHKVRRAA